MSDIRNWFGPVTVKHNRKEVTESVETPIETPVIEPGIESREIIVYTDGSAIGNGSVNATGGIGVFFGDNDPRNICKRVLVPRVTNNICELFAVIQAIETIVATEATTVGLRIVIFTDSEYIVKSVIQYSKAWEKNGYKNKRGQPIKNMDLMKRVIALYKKYNVKLHHCMAHKTEPRDPEKRKVWYGNKMADLMARKAATQKCN